MRRLAIASIAILLPFAALGADVAKYWTVHIDHPSDRRAYEQLERQFNDTIRDFYTANQVDQPENVKFVTDDGRYYGLRPRATLADIEKPSALGPDLSKQLQSKTAPISEETHKTLREHHNELWMVERDFTTVAEITPRKYMTLRTDFVRPPKNDAYEVAMQQLVKELSGVEVVAFFSLYGDGSYRYLFLSDSPIKVRALRGLAETRDSPAHF